MELYHYGIKGMKWGIRRYQYADGTLTPAGKNRYQSSNNSILFEDAKYMLNNARATITGKQYVDSYIKQGTTLNRIQTNENFERFAFYATYKKADSDKYMGLFGKNLIDRAAARNESGGMKVYQLKLESIKKLKIPSDDNVSDITAKLLRDSKFKADLEGSISDSKSKMLRPTQQVLFEQAQNALKKNPEKLTNSEKKAIYKAFNLSLVNHNPQEIAAQDRLYTELKKKGYNALLDYNDKEYSSYHAKRPVIVFDVNSVKLQSVAELDPKTVSKLNTKYNAERIIKEIPANTVGVLGKYSQKTVSECESYVRNRFDDYLNQK